MTSLKVGYALSIGAWSVDSLDDPHTELVELETQLALGSPLAPCHITVYAPALQPGALESGAGAATGAAGLAGAAGGGGQFSFQLRDETISYGDPITLTLTAGDVSEQVLTARVESVRSSLGRTRISGRNALQTLAGTRLDQVYENQTAGAVVSDLASQAGIDASNIETGSTYAYLTVHRSRSLLDHALEIARRDGMDVYVDTDDALTMARFVKTTGDHAFDYGVHILDLQVGNHQVVSDRVVVAGESPSSSRGSTSWPWMLKDGGPMRSEVGSGARMRMIADGAVRTKGAADRLAQASMDAIRAGATSGRLRLLGCPQVRLGDAIDIGSAPRAELNGTYKVSSVRHVLNKREGFVTIVHFTALTAPAGVGGALGQLGGAVAGAVGL